MQQTNVFVVLPGENILENGVNVEGHKAVNGSALQGTERAEADYATDQLKATMDKKDVSLVSMEFAG